MRKRITREQAIDDLRKKLLELTDDETSICKVAAEKGIFCHGFTQWKLVDLRRHYPTITRSHPHTTREEMEDLANRWQVARQTAHGSPLACDAQMQEGAQAACAGWDEFDDEALEGFHLELLGEEIEIQPPIPA